MLKSLLKKIWDGGDDHTDSDLYAAVAEELAEGSLEVGLWTKATAFSDGSVERAKASYIQMRVRQIRDERQTLLNQLRTHFQAEEERLERDRLAEVAEQQMEEHIEYRKLQEEFEVEREASAARLERQWRHETLKRQIHDVEVERKALMEKMGSARIPFRTTSIREKLVSLDAQRTRLVSELEELGAYPTVEPEEFDREIDEEGVRHYDSFKDWLEEFKEGAGDANDHLATTHKGNLIDFMDLSPLRRAYADGVEPYELGFEFGEHFNLSEFLQRNHGNAT